MVNINEDNKDSRGGCTPLDHTSEKGDDRTLGIVGVYACRCPSIDDFQQVDVRDVVCAHHRPQSGL